MTDVTEMPKYDGMEYEELVVAAQYMWMENAKLHEYVTKLEQANIVLDSDNTELLNDMRDMQMIVTDNHKLRELVRDMMGFFEDGDWCVKCERARDCQAQEQYEDECLMRFVFRDRMRELGVNAE